MQLISAQLRAGGAERDRDRESNKDKGTSYKALLQYLVEMGMECSSTRELLISLRRRAAACMLS